MVFAAIRIWRLLRLVPIALAASVPAHASPAPLVSIGQQQYVGTHEAGAIAAFKGIAYARPPLGELRWKAPQPLEPARGRIDADQFGPACPQSEGNTRWYRGVATAMGADSGLIRGPDRISEDCLYLNVWTPKARTLPAGKRLPVMVWIHGGSNENGYSHEPNYLGTNLARQGVVVVSINYRVGLLGFFAHPALGPDASGRQGLLDQVAALRWIRANIARFGGDPQLITVMGESAGGTNAAVLAAIPETRGLIARVIVQSGYLTPPEITPRGAVMGAAQSARLASGLFAADTTAASLRALRWEDIVAVQSQKLPGHFYAPVAEWPRALSLPLLIGSNADEYLMYLPSDEAGQARELSAELADYTPERAAQIRAVFARLPGSHAGRVDAVSSGKAFLCPAAKLADIVSASGRKVFAYRFERVRPGQHGLGAYHGAEIPYVFDSHDNWLAGDDQDRALSRAMQAYWVQFARSGNPNRPGLPAWPQWQNKSPRVIALDAKIETKPAPLAQLCALL